MEQLFEMLIIIIIIIFSYYSINKLFLYVIKNKDFYSVYLWLLQIQLCITGIKYFFIYINIKSYFNL